ncbi:MAG: hypothetical protein U0694_24535 [Anaerolineae bacterium]
MEIVSHITFKDGEARIERKPHLKAEMVARLYVDGECSIEEVMAHYELTAAEVHAALVYYYDNREALDAAYVQILAEIDTNAMTLDKFKAKLTTPKSDAS